MNLPDPAEFLADERGSALVELAVILTIMVLLLTGMVDYTFAIHEAMQVQQAASAGAAYGAIPGNESDLSGIQTAATNAAAGVPGFSVKATNLWACSASGASVSSLSVCASGYTPFKYVVVKASGTVPKPLSFPGISPSGTVNGSAVFQVPWSQ